MKQAEVMEIRKDFPYLNAKEVGKEIIYFDNGATTQRPQQIIDAVGRYCSFENANPHRSAHHLSMASTQAYDVARETIQRFINAERFEEIVFTRNATEAINLVSYAYAMPRLKPGDEILISIMEHHSNLCTWQNVCKHTGATLKYVYLDENKQIPMEEFREKMTENVKILAITGASNTVATCPDVKEMIRIAKEKGAVTLVDGAQLVAHHRVDVRDLDCDFLVFSGHKLLSPMGIGVLYGRIDILNDMEPFLYGGDMVEYVYEQETTFAPSPYKFEAGTQNVAGAVGLRVAIQYLLNIGFDKIVEHEKMLTDYAFERMKDLKYLDVYTTPSENRGPIILFNYKEVHPHDVASIMDAYGIAVRSGHHCAAPLHHYLGVNASCRASFAFYNTLEEVDRFIEALPKVQEVFGLGY